jgi:hypothetical protein
MTTSRTELEGQLTPFAYRVNDACRLIGIGRTKLYELARCGRIRLLKIDGCSRVEAASIAGLVAASRKNEASSSGRG